MFSILYIGCYLVTFALCVIILCKLKNSFLKFIGAFIAWSIGMILTHKVGQAHGTQLMQNATPQDFASEDFIASIPDGPNLSSGWIITGWIPLLLAYLIVRKISPATPAKSSE